MHHDVALHNDFLKKIQDLEMLCTEIIKPFIYMLYTETIIYKYRKFKYR
jgi:hypothetical protein